MSSRWYQAGKVIGLLSGRWTLAVLAELADGGRRYQELQSSLEGISHKVLTDTLRRAERDGLIRRQLDSGRAETATLYQLTELGRSLDEPLGALDAWAHLNWQSAVGARHRWDRLRDMHRAPAGVGSTGRWPHRP